ncbi:hypothetical protein [Sulfurovum sp.]|uniref:hypothetical protein n=1 Tax=Sulfurovum sp. TaxID=1969726 RepID=UPI0035670ED4
MDTGKIYHDSEGQECSIWQAVRREPDWAASRIQVGEIAIARVAVLEKALKEIADMPDVRSDECCIIASHALDTKAA